MFEWRLFSLMIVRFSPFVISEHWVWWVSITDIKKERKRSSFVTTKNRSQTIRNYSWRSVWDINYEKWEKKLERNPTKVSGLTPIDNILLLNYLLQNNRTFMRNISKGFVVCISVLQEISDLLEQLVKDCNNHVTSLTSTFFLLLKT